MPPFSDTILIHLQPTLDQRNEHSYGEAVRARNELENRTI